MFLPQDLTRAASRFVLHVAGKAPVHVIAATTGDARADAGVRRAAELLGLDTVPPVQETAVAALVMHSSDADDEVRSLVRDSSAAPHNAAHRIAILHGNATPYARTLHEQLSAAGVTFNGPGVRPTAERTIPRAFTTLLDALDSGGLDRATLLDIVSGAPSARPTADACR